MNCCSNSEWAGVSIGVMEIDGLVTLFLKLIYLCSSEGLGGPLANSESSLPKAGSVVRDFKDVIGGSSLTRY